MANIHFFCTSQKTRRMKHTKIDKMMTAILIAFMSVCLTSCKENKEPEPEPDLSCAEILGEWYKDTRQQFPLIDLKYFIYFKKDGLYSLVTENETINGIYKIQEKEKGMHDFVWKDPMTDAEWTNNLESTRYKILASGSNVFDILLVYVTYRQDGSVSRLIVNLYSGNERVRVLYTFMRNDNKS